MVWTLTKITKVLACNRTELNKDFLTRLSSRFEFFARYSSFGLVFRRTVQNPGATLTDTTKAGLIHKISNSIQFHTKKLFNWFGFNFARFYTLFWLIFVSDPITRLKAVLDCRYKAQFELGIPEKRPKTPGAAYIVTTYWVGIIFDLLWEDNSWFWYNIVKTKWFSVSSIRFLNLHWNFNVSTHLYTQACINLVHFSTDTLSEHTTD